MTGAYAFTCRFDSTEALCVRLNQIAWQWRVGDSHWYGDYLAARPFAGVRIRIVDLPAKAEDGWIYQSDIRVSNECTTAMDVIDRAYREVLVQVPARDIHEIEWFD